MREVAESNFRGIDKLNCAQAILKTFKESYDVCETTIASHSKSGGGRVEGNTCGAIYAATLLEPDELVRKKLTDGFVKEAGSLKCRDIRKSKSLTCHQCVGLTAELLEKHLNN